VLRWAAGGGGTFVALGSNFATATPLIVAGGGAGVYPGGDSTQTMDGRTTLRAAGSDMTTTVGYGATSNQCGGGAGGFYSTGGTDTSGYMFPGGQGFRQGGAGAIVPSSYTSMHTNGGFGGGGIANYVGLCVFQGGSGGGYFISDYLLFFLVIYLFYFIVYVNIFFCH
jgi:hypothetical protein